MKFSLSLRPVIAETEEAAWAKTDAIVVEAKALREKAGLPTSGHTPPNAGSLRLLDYYDLGVATFLIRDFDPLNDAVAYGRDLIPLVRELVAQRDARPAAAAS